MKWRKVEFMAINCQSNICDPEGKIIESHQHLKYLGAQIAADASVDSELNQKLGVASHDFKLLQQVWKHSSLTLQFKFLVFMACIVQKLLYGLESAWLNIAAQRKLDGFQARCLRKILRIAPPHISRISNKFILQQFSAVPLSKTLLERQLLYFGHIARCDSSSILRKSVFIHDLELHELPLKQGRPRDTWG